MHFLKDRIFHAIHRAIMVIKPAVPLSPTVYYVEKRKTQRTLRKQIEQLIEWNPIQRMLVAAEVLFPRD